MRGTVYPAGGSGTTGDWLKWSEWILLMHSGFWPKEKKWRGTPLSSSTIWSASPQDKLSNLCTPSSTTLLLPSHPGKDGTSTPHQQAPRVPFHHPDHEQHGTDWCLPGGAEPRTTQDWHLYHGDGGGHLLPNRPALCSSVGGCWGAHG